MVSPLLILSRCSFALILSDAIELLRMSVVLLLFIDMLMAPSLVPETGPAVVELLSFPFKWFGDEMGVTLVDEELVWVCGEDDPPVVVKRLLFIAADDDDVGELVITYCGWWWWLGDELLLEDRDWWFIGGCGWCCCWCMMCGDGGEWLWDEGIDRTPREPGWDDRELGDSRNVPGGPMLWEVFWPPNLRPGELGWPIIAKLDGLRLKGGVR